MTEQHNLTDPHNWTTEYQPGIAAYYLTDPLTSEVLHPERHPSWLAQEPALQAGIDYLAERGDAVRVHIASGRHGSAEDLGDPAQGWFESQLAVADYYGFEAFPTSSSLQREAQHIGQQLHDLWQQSGLSMPDFLTTSGVRGEQAFVARQMLATIQYQDQTVSFCLDPLTDGTPTEQAILQAAQKVLAVRDAGKRGAIFAALQIARDYCAVAKMGTQLYEEEAARANRTLSVFMTRGPGHVAALKRIFGLLAVPTTETFLTPESVNSMIVRKIMKNISEQSLIRQPQALYLGEVALAQQF